TLLGFVAVTCSSTNAFGGFLITDRMLRMFKTAEERARGTRRPVELQAFALVAAVVAAVAGILYTTRPAGMAMGEYLHEHVAAEALRYCYILSAGMFVLGLKGLASPKRARAGMSLAAFGMFVAVVGTLFHPHIVTSGVYLVVTQAATAFFYVMVGLALVFGLLLVIPIGAADMPVVIALLNSYGGLADAAMGFVLMNKIQIITGSLDGTSGFLLSLLMCRAMNRSAANVLFGAFGRVSDVVGANDVTNPAAKNNKSSPLYGMPILEVDRAKSIIVLKRSMRPGFAGVDNDLYYNEKCMMLFGDAKDSLTKLISEMKSLL